MSSCLIKSATRKNGVSMTQIGVMDAQIPVTLYGGTNLKYCHKDHIERALTNSGSDSKSTLSTLHLSPYQS